MAFPYGDESTRAREMMTMTMRKTKKTMKCSSCYPGSSSAHRRLVYRTSSSRLLIERSMRPQRPLVVDYSALDYYSVVVASCSRSRGGGNSSRPNVNSFRPLLPPLPLSLRMAHSSMWTLSRLSTPSMLHRCHWSRLFQSLLVYLSCCFRFRCMYCNSISQSRII